MNPSQYCYEYPRPSVGCDNVLIGIEKENIYILLIKRLKDPFKDQWALPGGFLDMDETADTCAQRELEEETNIKNLKATQVQAFTKVDRDPRGRILSIAYLSLVRKEEIQFKAGDDAAQVAWHSIHQLPTLAFDHLEIVKKSLEFLNDNIILNKHQLFTNGNFSEKDLQIIQKTIKGLYP